MVHGSEGEVAQSASEFRVLPLDLLADGLVAADVLERILARRQPDLVRGGRVCRKERVVVRAADQDRLPDVVVQGEVDGAER